MGGRVGEQAGGRAGLAGGLVGGQVSEWVGRRASGCRSAEALTEGHAQLQSVVREQCQMPLLCATQVIAVLLEISLQHVPHQHALSAQSSRRGTLPCF